MDFSDFLLDVIIPFVFQKSDINDHIDLVGSVCDRIPCLENFCRRCVVSVRESDHGTDWKSALHILRRLLHIAGGNAHAGAAVLDAVVADGPDLGPGGRLGQQGMVDLTEDLVPFHGVIPPFCVR